MTKKVSHLSRLLSQTIVEYGWCANNLLKDSDVVGIEIEAEGVPADGIDWKTCKGWAVHNDGSLRNGVEFVSSAPRPVAGIKDDVERLNAMFGKVGYVPVYSFRTSLHVHVNVQDFTHLELMNLFALYTLFEQPLLELGGEERVGNVHCMPVFLASYPLEQIRAGLNKTTGRLDANLQLLMRNDLRYASFNWASIAKFGTVEFRSHRGTSNPDTIDRWVRLLMDMKNMARHFNSPVDIVQNFSSMGPNEFTKMVFGNEAFRDLCALRTKELWEGLRNVQYFAFAADDWTPAARKDKPEPEPVTEGFIPAGVQWVGENVAGNMQWRMQDFANAAAPVPAPANNDAARRAMEAFQQVQARQAQRERQAQIARLREDNI